VLELTVVAAGTDGRADTHLVDQRLRMQGRATGIAGPPHLPGCAGQGAQQQTKCNGQQGKGDNDFDQRVATLASPVAVAHPVHGAASARRMRTSPVSHATSMCQAALSTLSATRPPVAAPSLKNITAPSPSAG